MFFVNLRGAAVPFVGFLEWPGVALKSPEPVPKTRPQSVACLGGVRWRVTLAARDVCAGPDLQDVSAGFGGAGAGFDGRGSTRVYGLW